MQCSYIYKHFVNKMPVSLFYVYKFNKGKFRLQMDPYTTSINFYCKLICGRAVINWNSAVGLPMFALNRTCSFAYRHPYLTRKRFVMKRCHASFKYHSNVFCMAQLQTLLLHNLFQSSYLSSVVVFSFRFVLITYYYFMFLMIQSTTFQTVFDNTATSDRY